MNEKILLFGLALIFIGMFIVFFSSMQLSAKGEKNVKAAGGIFIGPIPVLGFFSDKKMFYLLCVIAIIFFVLFYAFRKLWFP